jgi:hypothetical protein
LVALGTMLVLSARDGRAVVFGLTLVLLVVPLAVEPPPALLTLAFREIAALLAGYVLWVGVRRAREAIIPMPLGGTTEAVFVGLAFALGLLVPDSGPGPAGAPSLAAALAAGGGALMLLAFGPGMLRLCAGAVLFLIAAVLGSAWLTGALTDAAQVSAAAALLAASVASAWISLNTLVARDEAGLARPRDLRDVG